MYYSFCGRSINNTMKYNKSLIGTGNVVQPPCSLLCVLALLAVVSCKGSSVVTSHFDLFSTLLVTEEFSSGDASGRSDGFSQRVWWCCSPGSVWWIGGASVCMLTFRQCYGSDGCISGFVFGQECSSGSQWRQDCCWCLISKRDLYWN